MDEVPQQVWAAVRSLDRVPAPRTAPEQDPEWDRVGDYEIRFYDNPRRDT